MPGEEIDPIVVMERKEKIEKRQECEESQVKRRMVRVELPLSSEMEEYRAG